MRCRILKYRNRRKRASLRVKYQKFNSFRPSDGQAISYDPPEECDNMYYYVSNGYRKTADNICRGGIDHPKTRLTCPGKWGLVGLLMNFFFRVPKQYLPYTFSLCSTELLFLWSSLEEGSFMTSTLPKI